MLIYKFGILRQLIAYSNVAVLDPVSQQMNFSIPKEISSESEETEYFFMTVSVPFESVETQFEGSRFLFNGSVWNAIDGAYKLESNLTDNEEYKLANDAMNWLLQFTKDRRSKIYTMLDEDGWAPHLNIEECKDAIEAIMRNIVLRVEGINSYLSQ